jgi:excinuclease ABC subunit A
MNQIVIRGAREHNLKGVDLEIPRGQLVVITGMSGSGKSSLAFDTIYAEGQRRYVESLSVYARQFMEQLARPDVDTIEGLSPAICIEQRPLARNPRSTVGTVTEIYDYLRLLYARVGQPHCHRCREPLVSQTVQEVVSQLFELPEGSRLSVLAPIVRAGRGGFGALFEQLRRDGYTRVNIDGEMLELASDLEIDPAAEHSVDVYVDRLILKARARSRLAESLELAMKLADGVAKVILADGNEQSRHEERLFSERLLCHRCGVSAPELTPRLFSFNSPDGACPKCAGLGSLYAFDESLIVPDPSRSLREGAIEPWRQRRASHYQQLLERLAEVYDFSLVRPFRELPRSVRDMLLHGTEEEIAFDSAGRGKRHRARRPFEGVFANLSRRMEEARKRRAEADSAADPERLEEDLEQFQRYMSSNPCPECKGKRLRAEARHVLIEGQSICDVGEMSVAQALEFLTRLQLQGLRREIAQKLLGEIHSRLSFLAGVGVDYLTIDRSTATLSGGEGQRVRLATQIGASLVGVLYVLDEPSIGLHQRDNERLLQTLRRLRDQGNSVLVVEHDEDTIRAADFVVDMGPGAGQHGGEVVACGTVDQIVATDSSLTGQYLGGKLSIPRPARRRGPSKAKLVLRGVSHNNLAQVDVELPLGRLVCVTGVSGSGKSSLVMDTLLPALRQRLHGAACKGGALRSIEGVNLLERVIAVDQTPLGRTPRSNAATYTGMLSFIRELFAGLPESRMRGFRAGRFSFNVKGGRCEACRGDGTRRIEMHFLPDIYVTCAVCGGSRYSDETLRIKYRGKSIADVLAMSVDQALDFFAAVPRVREKLLGLKDVGLGYLGLGQPANTLSGGEAQRVKLSRELGRRSIERTLYVLDEPTTGLHFADIQLLLQVLGRLVEAGSTVLVIEHHLDVIKCADHVIDLGPGGGAAGGQIVGAGTPEELVHLEQSATGQYLRRVLQ